MWDARAVTIDGFVARVQAMLYFAPDYLAGPGEVGCWDDVQIAALLRDLVAMGGRS